RHILSPHRGPPSVARSARSSSGKFPAGFVVATAEFPAAAGLAVQTPLAGVSGTSPWAAVLLHRVPEKPCRERRKPRSWRTRTPSTHDVSIRSLSHCRWTGDFACLRVRSSVRAVSCVHLVLLRVMPTSRHASDWWYRQWPTKVLPIASDRSQKTDTCI